MNKTIIIIDDEVEFSKSLARNLEAYQFNAMALNTYDQVKSFSFQNDQTILVDLRFGQKSGLEIIGQIRKQTSDAFIVMMTGFGTISTAVEAMKLGANDYLTKPFRLNQLLKVINPHSEEENITEENELGTDMSLDRVEREYIEYILAQENGNITKAAKRLGLHRQSLQRKLKKYVPNK